MTQKAKYWSPDPETYQQIQELLPFVDFVAMLNETNEEQFKKAIEIKNLIKNIDNPDPEKQWCVCLDIHDWNINSDEDGPFMRKWWVYFENGMLSIEAETECTTDGPGNYSEDYYCYTCINFPKKIKCDRKYMDEEISSFVEDALKYKSYMTEKLKEVEVDIDVW